MKGENKMNIVIISHPYHQTDKNCISAIPADKIVSVEFQIGGTGAQSNPFVYYIRVQVVDESWQVFDFNKDETAALNCFNSIVEQMRGE